jgi:hypothetical protein
VLVAALLLGVAAVRAPRGDEPQDAARREVGIPQPIEPIGIVDDPPTRFTWTPGGDDVDLSQLIVYGRDMARLWESAPLDTNVAVIPLDAYSGVGAGQTCFWRVREVSDGKARAASAIKVFAFRRDLAGNVVEPKLPPEFATPPAIDEAPVPQSDDAASSMPRSGD